MMDPKDKYQIYNWTIQQFDAEDEKPGRQNTELMVANVC